MQPGLYIKLLNQKICMCLEDDASIVHLSQSRLVLSIFRFNSVRKIATVQGA